jgi:hypothetical protein
MTAGIMAGQLGTLFAMRTSVKSAFISIFRNKWLVGAAIISFLLLMAVTHIPIVNRVFFLSPIDPVFWLALYAFAPVIFLSEEARKAILRKVMKVPPGVPTQISTVALQPISKPLGAIPKTLFVERSKPVVMLTSLVPGDEEAFSMALTAGGQGGSRVILAKTQSTEAEQWMKKKFDILAMDGVGATAPFEYKDTPFEIHGKTRVPGAALRTLVDSSDAGTLILTVSREAFSKRGYITKHYAWLREYSDMRIILVCPGTAKRNETHGYRILIPVLKAFHRAPFELASALSENRIIPDIDVIVAKVVEMPAITPLYSIYRPESLVDSRKQLSFLQNMKGWPLLKVIHSKVLLVRNTVRDLVDFAAERKVDIVILEGDRARERTGFTVGAEREIAEKAKCTVAVVIPPESAS